MTTSIFDLFSNLYCSRVHYSFLHISFLEYLFLYGDDYNEHITAEMQPRSEMNPQNDQYNSSESSGDQGEIPHQHLAERITPIYVKPNLNYLKCKSIHVNFIRSGSNVVSDQMTTFYYPEIWKEVYESSTVCTVALCKEMQAIERVQLAFQICRVKPFGDHRRSGHPIYYGHTISIDNHMVSTDKTQVLNFVSSFINRPVCVDEIGMGNNHNMIDRKT